MNSRTSNPRDIADEARRLGASRARRVDQRGLEGSTRARNASIVRFVIVAALVSAASMVAVTALIDDAPRGATVAAATREPASPPVVITIDHGGIAPDAISVGDVETVEASIAAYER